MTDKPDMKSRHVRAGETPLDANLGHRYLDVIREGGEAFDDGTASPYSGHSLEHCLHATGWVQRDLRVALDKVSAERQSTEARHAAELREQAERFEAFRQEVSDAVEGFWNYCRTTNTPFPADLDSFIIPKPDPLVEDEDPIDALVDLLAPVLTHSQGMAARERENRFRNAIAALRAQQKDTNA